MNPARQCLDFVMRSLACAFACAAACACACACGCSDLAAAGPPATTLREVPTPPAESAYADAGFLYELHADSAAPNVPHESKANAAAGPGGAGGSVREAPARDAPRPSSKESEAGPPRDTDAGAGGEEAADVTVDGGAPYGHQAQEDCAHLLACVRSNPEARQDCLGHARGAALAQVEAVLQCRDEACAIPCRGILNRSDTCEACLLARCSLPFVSCAQSSGCGDGIVESLTETCDDGNQVPTDQCTDACTAARCGDGIVHVGTEACDDGNGSDEDDCLVSCTLARCGDGILQHGAEGCDDSNHSGGDGCDPTCRLEQCGNGQIDSPEECDDGPHNGEHQPCLDTCRVNRCGDGQVCSDEASGCGTKHGSILESCDDGNDEPRDDCYNCHVARCGDGVVEHPSEECDDGNANRFDACAECRIAANHLLITEIAIGPAGGEFIELFNPTASPVDLSEYGLSDSARYVEVATASVALSTGSDFVARFPPGSTLASGAYATVAVANADGPDVSFYAVYGKLPDYELRPTANGASDNPGVPNLQSTAKASTIGATSSLTDAGESIVLFRIRSGEPIEDVDYVYYGTPTTSNPVIDKTGLVVEGHSYIPDMPGINQHPIPAPGERGSLQRCVYAEWGERPAPLTDESGSQVDVGWGNGITGHDETAENWQRAFAESAPAQRTPGAAPPVDVCP